MKKPVGFQTKAV